MNFLQIAVEKLHCSPGNLSYFWVKEYAQKTKFNQFELRKQKLMFWVNRLKKSWFKNF